MAEDTPFLTDQRIDALAPTDLRFTRSGRYHGDGLSVPLEAFELADGHFVNWVHWPIVGATG